MKQSKFQATTLHSSRLEDFETWLIKDGWTIVGRATHDEVLRANRIMPTGKRRVMSLKFQSPDNPHLLVNDEGRHTLIAYRRYVKSMKDLAQQGGDHPWGNSWDKNAEVQRYANR